MRIILVVAIMLFLSGFACGQEQQNPKPNTDVMIEQLSDLPIARRSPPKINMQRALKLAESYMRKQKIVTSQYYLVEAKYTFIERESSIVPCWRFLLIKGDSQRFVGHDLEAYVFMNGLVWLPPVM